MWSIVNHGNFVGVSTDDTKEDSFYMIKFTYNSYTIDRILLLIWE